MDLANLDQALRDIIADENARVGWKEYAAHIRKGGADDLAARVSMEIARRAFRLAESKEELARALSETEKGQGDTL